jgi:hypothetical protein
MSDETAAEPQTERRRRANAPGGRKHKHEVKVTPEEEGRLLRLALAQRVTIPRLLVETTLASETGENQIAKATNATGQRQAETDATLAAVRRVAERIDAAVDELSLS